MRQPGDSPRVTDEDIGIDDSCVVTRIRTATNQFISILTFQSGILEFSKVETHLL